MPSWVDALLVDDAHSAGYAADATVDLVLKADVADRRPVR